MKKCCWIIWKKFDEWKKHSTIDKEKTSSKELVGLVFKTDYKLTVELLDETVESQLKREVWRIQFKRITNEISIF